LQVAWPSGQTVASGWWLVACGQWAMGNGKWEKWQVDGHAGLTSQAASPSTLLIKVQQPSYIRRNLL